MKRAEIEEKYKWDLSGYFKSDDDFYKEYESLKGHLGDFRKYKGKLSNESILLECLRFDDQISLRLEILYVYASSRVFKDA